MAWVSSCVEKCELGFQSYFEQVFAPTQQASLSPASIYIARRQVELFLVAIGEDLPIGKVDASTIEQFRVAAAELGYSPTSVQRAAEFVRRVCRHHDATRFPDLRPQRAKWNTAPTLPREPLPEHCVEGSLQWWLREYCRSQPISESTKTLYFRAVRRFELWAGKRLTLIEACLGINQYVARLGQGNAVTGKTLRKPLVTLLRNATSAGLCQMPLRVRPVRLRKRLGEPFSPGELQALLASAKPLEAAVIRMVFDTGRKRKELFAATWASIAPGPTGAVYTGVSKWGRVVRRKLSDET